jgi:uncharacterized protein (DUF58 family)
MSTKATTSYRFLPPELAESLGGFGLSVRKPVVGTLQGLHRSPHLGVSVEFAEYREYVRGDPVQLIDWAVYARSDKHVIRRFREETNLRAYILLDISESMDFKSEGLYSKIDYASYLAAALMYILVREGDAAALTTFDKTLQTAFKPTSSFEGLRPMLLNLESIHPSAQGDIEASLHDAAESIHPRSLVILISDLLHEPQAILRGLQHLQHKGHDTTVFHLLDPGELRLSMTGMTEIRELETGRKLLIEPDQLRDAYNREVEHYIDEIRRGCANGLANYLLVNTATPIIEAIHRRADRK